MALKEALFQTEDFFTFGKKLSYFYVRIIGQGHQDSFVLCLQIIHVLQCDPAKAGVGLGGKGFAGCVGCFPEIIQDTKKMIAFKGLHQVMKCLDFIRIHRILTGGGQENNRDRLMIMAQFSRGIHSVEKRHNDIKNDQVHTICLVCLDQVISIGEAVWGDINPSLICPLF